jgi:hypothetical protein
VLEGGVDAENACQPVRTITRLVQRSRNGEERGYLAPVAGMCSQERAMQSIRNRITYVNSLNTTV